MKTNAELVKIIETKRIKYSDALKEKKEANVIKDLKLTYFRTQVELFSRYATVPQIILFIFLGFSLGIKRGRGGSGNNSARALIFLISYYILYFFLISLAQGGKLDPAVANFGPSVLLFFIALHFYKRLDWAG